MTLIKATELNFSEGKSISLKSTLIKSAIKQLRDKGLTTDEEFEHTLELPELIIEMYDILCLQNKTRKNTNAKKKVV
jgi:hypothetical protein